MAKNPMSDSEFNRLMGDIKNETSSVERKHNLLYYSKGFFNGVQAAQLLGAYKSALDRIRAIKTLERRLCRISCAEAREILLCVSITQEDRLVVLDCIKRALVDHQTIEGVAYILSAFVYEKDKKRALDILTTVNSYLNRQMASGGHQGYGPLGELYYSQAFPLKKHMYGPTEHQFHARDPAKKPYIPPTASMERVRPAHHSLVSFANDDVVDKSYYLGGGQPPLPPMPVDNTVAGRPLRLGEPRKEPMVENSSYSNAIFPQGVHQSAPVSVGFTDITSASKADTCCNYATYL